MSQVVGGRILQSAVALSSRKVDTKNLMRVRQEASMAQRGYCEYLSRVRYFREIQNFAIPMPKLLFWMLVIR